MGHCHAASYSLLQKNTVPSFKLINCENDVSMGIDIDRIKTKLEHVLREFVDQAKREALKTHV